MYYHLNPYILTSDQSTNIELDYINIGLESISDVTIQIEGNIVGVSVSNNFTDILEFLPNQIISGNPLTLHVSSSILNGTQIMLPITFSTELGYEQLDYLVNMFGSDHIVMGTDYPYDMAEDDPVGHVLGSKKLSETDIKKITGGNASRLLNIDD